MFKTIIGKLYYTKKNPAKIGWVITCKVLPYLVIVKDTIEV